jgi:AraC-like DNA-binding protein
MAIAGAAAEPGQGEPREARPNDEIRSNHRHGAAGRESAIHTMSTSARRRSVAEPERMVRSATLSHYGQLVGSLGLDPAPRIAGAGLPSSCLLDPDKLIPAARVCRLLEATAEETGLEDFGLRLALSRSLTVLGPLGLIMGEESTARRALEALVRYMAVHSEALLTIVEEAGDTLVIRQSLMLREVEVTRQADDMSLGVLCRVVRELIGPHWQPRRICFCHDAPKSVVTHERVFGKVPEFGSDFNGLVCLARELEAIPPNSRPEIARYAREYLNTLLAQKNQSLTDRVTRLVRTLLSTGRCSIEEISDHLAVDRRTVHRKLAREGSTFSAILDGVRSDLAQQYLRGHDRPIGDVSQLLGFSSPSTFSRWFHDRFGHSATRWRESRRRPRASDRQAVPK